MKKFAVVIVAATMILPIVMTGCGAVTVPEVTGSEETAAELGPADPKEDFYRYVNEERFKTAEFEYGTTSVEMAFNQDLIDDQIEAIIDDVVAGNGYEVLPFAGHQHLHTCTLDFFDISLRHRQV